MRLNLAAVVLAVSVLSSWAGELVPDFKLVDVNPNSTRSKQLVSPRDYRLQISAYYFGEAH
jgi:hypothetical protein